MSQNEREPQLGKRERSERKHGGNDGLHGEGRQFTIGEEGEAKNLPSRSSRKYDRMSGRKRSPEETGESHFYFKSSQT